MNEIHLPPDMVPQALRGSYAGRTFKAVVCDSVTVPRTAGLWDGGSRETYRAIALDTGAEIQVSDNLSAPSAERRDHVVTLRPGFAMIRHSVFCGKDSGLTFYVHPDNAAKILPARVDLSTHERIVLVATRSLKSSHGGRDRYEMARDEYRCREILAGTPHPTRAEWDAAKVALIGRGFLNKAGAITPAGRNAAQ